MIKSLYPLYRWLVWIPFLIIWTLLMGVLCVTISFFSGELASRIVGRSWSKLNLLASLSRVEVITSDRFDPGASYIVVANHLSDFDIFAVYGWLDLSLKWVMKEELRKMPVIGIAGQSMGFIFVDRKNRQKAIESMEAFKKRLKPGVSVMFFPEGTRSRNGKLAEFKAGAFVMAKDLDLPILPVTIIGSERVLPADTIRLFPGRIQLVIGDPIPVEKVRLEGHRELAQIAREQIKANLPARNI